MSCHFLRWHDGTLQYWDMTENLGPHQCRVDDFPKHEGKPWVLPDGTLPPPLGLTPREIHRTQRIEDILGAIRRYADVDKRIPPEWADELSQLVDEHNEGKPE